MAARAADIVSLCYSGLETKLIKAGKDCQDTPLQEYSQPFGYKQTRWLVHEDFLLERILSGEGNKHSD
jgi:hypothetical protein